MFVNYMCQVLEDVQASSCIDTDISYIKYTFQVIHKL